MGDREAVLLDIPAMSLPEAGDLKCIKWCEGHWAELMFALKDRGLDDQLPQQPMTSSLTSVNFSTEPSWSSGVAIS